MALVVRVKRRLNEEPHEALVLSCKKRKIGAEADEPVTAVFKFAGTVARQDENVNANLSQLLEKQGIKDIRKPASEVLKKSRLETKFQSENNRYKLVNYFRSLDDSQLSVEGEADDKGKELTVIDVEAHIEGTASQSTVPKNDADEDVSKTEPTFVYDLYHKQPDEDILDVDDLILDGIICASHRDGELVFESYRGHQAQAADSDSEDNFEDEDSNDENNWRNDYPDEDEFNSDQDSLANGIDRVMIGNEELSTDDESDVYGEELTTDELRYGSRYAKFKKRVCEEFENEKSDEDTSTNSESELSGLDLDE